MRYTIYNRVIPRDLFNEAKLLKCFGQLALKIHERQVPTHLEILIKENEHGDPFHIGLLEMGSLTIHNYPTTINGRPVTFHTIYNSKRAYPMFCMVGDTDYQVFEEDGSFSQEFINITI